MLQSAVVKKNLVAPSCQAASSQCPQWNAACDCDSPYAVGIPIGTKQGFSGTRLPRAAARSTSSASRGMLEAAVEKVEQILNRPNVDSGCGKTGMQVG